MPGICCSRHWWDGERWSPTVRLHQFALVRHSRGGCRLFVWLNGCRRGRGLCSASQCRLEGGDSVELYPRQTADEAWGVVTLDEEWVYVSSLCTETQGGREAGITGMFWCFVICLMRLSNQCNVILSGTMPVHIIDIGGIRGDRKSARRKQGAQTLTIAVFKEKASEPILCTSNTSRLEEEGEEGESRGGTHNDLQCQIRGWIMNQSLCSHSLSLYLNSYSYSQDAL